MTNLIIMNVSDYSEFAIIDFASKTKKSKRLFASKKDSTSKPFISPNKILEVLSNKTVDILFKIKHKDTFGHFQNILFSVDNK